MLLSWFRWRYRQMVTFLTGAFYLCNPIISIIMTSNRATSDTFLRPLEDARRREEIAEQEWRSRKRKRE